jgi:hypothetical protein
MTDLVKRAWVAIYIASALTAAAVRHVQRKRARRRLFSQGWWG